MEEALLSLQEKWKLSTQLAILLFLCTSLIIVTLCSTTTLLKKPKKSRATKLVEQESCTGSIDNAIKPSRLESNSSEGSGKKLLMDYLRWSQRSQWDDLESGSWRQTPPLLLGSSGSEAELGWQSHYASSSPVWQRPILMGEKCELPRFSGLILYNEQGLPRHSTTTNPARVVTTLRDLL